MSSSENQVPANPAIRRSDWHVLIATLLYMGMSVIVASQSGNSEFVFYLVVMAILIAVVTAVHLRVRLSPGALWGLSAWGLLHMAGGLAPIPAAWPQAGDSQVLYNLWLVPGLLKYDQLVHAFGFGLVTWICWQGLASILGVSYRSRPSPGTLVLCVAGGMGFGALNELVEFVATISLPGTNVGGYLNTGWDLVANLVGCLVAAGIIRMASAPPALAAPANETTPTGQ